MAGGCLGFLFGWVDNSPSTSTTQDSGMSEGDIHSGPGGYEGMGYSGGYAAEYREELFDDEGDER